MNSSTIPGEPVGAQKIDPPLSSSSKQDSSPPPASSSFLDIPSFVLTGSTAESVHVWAALKSIVSERSKIPPLLLALSATVVNHARRTFFYGSPWAGYSTLRPDFADDWRVVLSRPDIYLNTLLDDVTFSKLAMLFISLGIWDYIEWEHTIVIDSLIERSTEQVPELAAVGYMVWLLSAIETSLARSSMAVAIVWSTVSLLQTNPLLLKRILVKQKLGVALLAYPLGYFIVAGLVPTALGAIRNSARGRPGVLLTILGTVGSLYTLLAYRSRLYIAIETSGLFVFLGTFAVSATLLLRARRSVRKEQTKKKEE